MATTTRAEAPDVVDRRLLTAATLFTAVVLFHGLDHLRRGVDTIDRDVFWAGASRPADQLVPLGVCALADAHR